MILADYHKILRCISGSFTEQHLISCRQAISNFERTHSRHAATPALLNGLMNDYYLQWLSLEDLPPNYTPPQKTVVGYNGKNGKKGGTVPPSPVPDIRKWG